MTNVPVGGDNYNELIGLELVEITADRVTARLPVTPKLHQPYGIMHGGVYCSVVETVASVGAATWFSGRGVVVGVSNHTNFLRATREGVVTAVATPVHRGRTQQLWAVKLTDQNDKLVASGEVRLANITDAAQLGG